MKLPRMTVRRSMLLVALVAVGLAESSHGGRRPGLYLRAAGWSAGVCRDDTVPREVGAAGRPGSRTYLAGLWRDRESGVVRAGALARRGQLWARLGGPEWLLW